MVEISFLKKLKLPTFSFKFLSSKPTRIVGIDIGVASAKVVQLRYEHERAILETYGELLSAGYLKNTDVAGGGGFLRYADVDIASLLKDIIRESGVTAKDAVFSVPAVSSFITTISFPRVTEKEINSAMPYEARKYVPIPVSEVVLDWDILEPNEERNAIEVLLVAVPRDVVEKYKRVAGIAGINPRALEVETFSMVRSLLGQDPTPIALINLGHQSTTLAIIDRGRVRVSHNIIRGSQELTKALERGMAISLERAESAKREIGISEKLEEREITSLIMPPLDSLFSEIERLMALYNRRAPRKIQRVNLTGGGSNLKGIVDYLSTKFGLEVTKGNPFARVVTPAFMQPILREIGPSFSVAVGLALHDITSK
ncbi:MAG: type IV pilus assembly protein PilM [Candidatus Sungiibacteriota bacterium]|uniref:Type IV pilus assembly protein PilM n=1 Tax=Candidatus Sungiibacteriota bacterium TaxID=2750080 RepID=A0A7T5RKA7_9BACT|nr:MAG: type IV pilus assembly protein PilM [Candidatus Sungbacteria bacterium]